MADPDQVDLRQRVCFACDALFWICRHCDRGQRYCSWLCRMAALLKQRRQANRRHQHSPEGRQDHRDRQREYRKRCAQRRWSSSATATLLSPALPISTNEPQVTPQPDGTPAVKYQTRGAGQSGEDCVTPAAVSPAPVRWWEPSATSPISQDERATAEKNVTDKSSAALVSPGMISAWNSVAAQTAARVGSSAAVLGFRTRPTWPRYPRNHPPPFLGCIVCGRRGHFVDPFPPIPRCTRF